MYLISNECILSRIKSTRHAIVENLLFKLPIILQRNTLAIFQQEISVLLAIVSRKYR